MNTAAESLQEMIHRAIPLSAAMNFQIEELGRSHILVTAPLEPNVNIHGTGFAGSIYSLAVLSAWGLAMHVLAEQGFDDADLVIARAEIKYRAPINGEIRCQCVLDISSIQGFIDELKKKNRARLQAAVTVGNLPEAELMVTLFASMGN